jgi:hypothetical protein
MALARSHELLKALWRDDDPLTRALIVYALGETHGEAVRTMIGASLESSGEVLQGAARWLETREARRAFQETGPVRDEPELLSRIEAIGNVPLFTDLTVRELAALAKASTTTQAREGEIIIREGEAGRVLFVLLSGRAEVIKGWGKPDEMVLDWIEANGFFGEMALIDGLPRSATIRTISAASLLVLRGEDLNLLIRDYPAIPIRLCKVLSQRIRTLHHKLTVHEGQGG